MEIVIAIGFIAGVFGLGYWIGSMRTKLAFLQPTPAPTPKTPKRTARKKVSK